MSRLSNFLSTGRQLSTDRRAVPSSDPVAIRWDRGRPPGRAGAALGSWGVSTRDVLRLVRAAFLGAGAELAALGLMATAAWLLLRAAERPPLGALTVAVVAVRTLALLRGGLRYA